MPTENQSNSVTTPRQGMEYWDKICSLKHYGLLHSPDGKRVVKAKDIGN